jgi:hypothetical protein
LVGALAIHPDKLFHHPELDREFENWKNVDTPRSDTIHYLTEWTSTRLHDGYPFLFKSKHSTRKAFICLYPKGGSTQLKFLFRYAMGGHNRTLKSFLNEGPHSQPYIGGGINEFRLKLKNTSVPRFLIIRNPYIRFLSAYMDKIERVKDAHFAPPGYKIGESFEKFVVKSIQYQNRFSHKRWEDFNDHFTLMSNLCGINASMTYDYYLPLEQMDYWYEPFIRALGIEEYTKVGWNITTRYFQGDQNSSCFYHTKGKTCEEMFTTVNESSISLLKHHHNNSTEVMKRHTKHVTNSASQLSKFFSNPDLLKALTNWMMPDLKQFHYPIWDGNDAEEYVKHLEQKSVRTVTK